MADIKVEAFRSDGSGADKRFVWTGFGGNDGPNIYPTLAHVWEECNRQVLQGNRPPLRREAAVSLDGWGRVNCDPRDPLWNRPLADIASNISIWFFSRSEVASVTAEEVESAVLLYERLREFA